MHIPTPISGLPDQDTTFARIGAAVAAIGTEACPPLLTALLRSVAPFSYTVVFGYCGAARPLDLYDDFPPAKRKIFVTDYQAGPYLLDPFFLAAGSTPTPLLRRIRDLAPDRFYQGEYFRNYYIQTGLAEEIGYFIDVGGGATVVLSLMRPDRPFGKREFRALDEVRPVVHAIVAQHWRGIAGQFAAPAPSAGHTHDRTLDQSFHGFGAGLLTAREREVVEYTLKGHSAEAVGRLLGIASGTVRIHRRNIYAKLQISSQGELFSRFIATLEHRSDAPQQHRAPLR
ncbi:MAG: hypothetical protein RIT14_1185 [Pseudomonadota bacterium]|jgi:DNA-binding CsgD family transcriptional regulator